jgi:hypothetical protein
LLIALPVSVEFYKLFEQNLNEKKFKEEVKWSVARTGLNFQQDVQLAKVTISGTIIR